MTTIKSMRGGEVLSSSNSRAKQSIDTRYYPFSNNVQKNISTDTSEYQLVECKNIASNVLEFEVDPSSTGYIDLKNSYVLVNHKIQRDGVDIGSRNVACYKENRGLIMFKDTKIYLNNKEVNDDHDSGLTPYAHLHKMCLMEEGNEKPKLTLNRRVITLIANGNNPSESDYNIDIPCDKRILSEGLYDMGCEYLQGTFGVTQTGSVEDEIYFKLKADQYGMNTVIRPRDAIWQQSSFLPPTTQLRVRLEKNDDSKLLHVNFGGCANVYGRATLFLRRVYPTETTSTSISALALQQPRLYPLTQSRTAYFNIPIGTSSINRVGLLSGSKPSILAVQFVKSSNFNVSDSFTGHPFDSGQIQPSFGAPSLSVNSLYCRVGSQRFPKNYEYGSDPDALFQDYESYNEYIRMCKTPDGEEIIKPFLSAASKVVQVYFINTRRNGEQMWEKQDEPTAMDSIELHCRFNSALTEDMVCIVSALSNSTMVISPSGQIEMMK
jgi:hypothetical protein